MFNKDALVSLEQSYKILKSCIYRPLSISSLKSLKNFSFTPFLSLSLALSIIFSPCISFANTLDKLGDYEDYYNRLDSSKNPVSYGGAYSLIDTYLDSIQGNYTNNKIIDNGIGGGAISLEKTSISQIGYIGLISGTFEGNQIHSTAGTSDTMGGAIYNNGYTIGSIIADFIENQAWLNSNGSTGGMGGAIYNNGTINSIIGDFTSNRAGVGVNGSSFAAFGYGGGAIFNASNGIINSIAGNFYDNSTGDSNSLGGAIFNQEYAYIGSITGTFTENDGYNGGGAIYNDTNAYIDYINAIFTGNYDSSQHGTHGAAIYNNGTINTIIGKFTYNELDTTYASGTTHGGAIYNTYRIGDIIADFIGNTIEVTVNTAAYGGAISNEGTDSFIGSIVGEFNSNKVTNSTSSAYGGAIYNTGIIQSISGSFNSNYLSAAGADSYGGAILNANSGSIGLISANFSGNYASATSTGNAYGGAIYNNTSASIAGIIGNFLNNYVTSNIYNAYGGAIYNAGSIGDIYGDFTSNTVSTYPTGTTFYAAGGAIYNTGTIGDIYGDFTLNKATINGSQIDSAYGGAIFNNGSSASISSITGDFTSNSVVNGGSNTNSYGGAIYNASSASIGSISGDFTANSVTSSVPYNAQGGAIYNASNAIIDSISGNFTGNSSSGTTSNQNNYFVAGGAIYNASSIGSITGTFTNNSTTHGYDKNTSNYTLYTGGGAIYNSSSITSINADFYYNKALSYSRGGAIFNSGSIGSISGNFIGNTANYANYGGAIYSTGNLKFLANNATYQFTDNLAGSDYNAIYIGTDTLRTLAFDMTGTGGFVMNDSISAGQLTSSLTSGYYNLTMTGQNLANNTFALNASITGLNTLDVSNTTLSLGSYLHENGSITQGSIEGNLLKFTNSNVAIDVSAVDTTSAAIQASSSTVNSLDYGRVNVSDSTLTLNRASAGESYLLATSTSNFASTWWEEDDIKTTSLLTTSIADYASLDPLDPNYDSLYNKNTTFTVITTLNTDNEILNSDFASLALASVDGTITNGATLDYIQKLTHVDISANDQSRLLEGGARISSASGASTNVKTAMVTSKNLLSARFDLVDSYALNGKITQLASNGLVMQETSSNISAWVMPMYAHESVDGMEAGSFTTAYKTDLYGVLAGMDTSFDMPFVDLARLGFSMNFGLGNSASSGDFENIDNDFKYYGAAFYASTQKGDNLAIHADLGYTATNSKVAYGLNGYSTDTKAQIDSSAMHLGALAEYSVYKENNVNLAPYVGVELLSIKTKDYDLEEDNASADTIFNMETDRQNLILIPVGAKVSKTHQARSNWLWLTQAKIGGQLALGNTHETVTVKAPNTSAYDTFTTQVYDMLSADAGFAVKAQNDSWQFGIDMNTQLSSNRLGLSLAGEIEYTF